MSDTNDPEAIGEYIRGLVRCALLLAPTAKILVLVDDINLVGPRALFTEVPYDRAVELIKHCELETRDAAIAALLAIGQAKGVPHG